MSKEKIQSRDKYFLFYIKIDNDLKELVQIFNNNCKFLYNYYKPNPNNKRKYI